MCTLPQIDVGRRSAERDTEAQIVILTTNSDMKQQFEKVRDHSGITFFQRSGSMFVHLHRRLMMPPLMILRENLSYGYSLQQKPFPISCKIKIMAN